MIRHNIRLSTTHIRSIREKNASLIDVIISKTIDIFAVTETWLRPHDTAACIVDISTPGYTFHHKPRLVGLGGGVGFLISKLFKVNLHISPDYTSFESMCVKFMLLCVFHLYLVIYPPPGHSANFFEEFQDPLENIATMHT